MAVPRGANYNVAAEEEGQSYLAPAFHFRVVFLGKLTGLKNSSPDDNSFLEVSGLSPEMELDSVHEGGENRFVHQLPKGVKYPKLVLKRGIADSESPLVAFLLIWQLSEISTDSDRDIFNSKLSAVILYKVL